MKMFFKLHIMISYDKKKFNKKILEKPIDIVGKWE